MKQFIITLDMGTTNTRAYLLDRDGKVIKTSFRNIGAGETAKSGSKQPIITAVTECLTELGNTEGVSAIVASGMITSGLGLKEVPHLTAPTSVKDIADNMVCEYFPEISSLPFWFVPGVKNNTDTVDKMDMMRGEETESVALMADINDDSVFILPGSHTKFVSVSAEKITSCLTTLTGELLSVITNSTIAAQAVEHSFADIDYFDADYLWMGYDAADKYGLARAAFGTRTLRVLNGITKYQAAWYLLGAVLQSDIAALKGADICGKTAVISGKEPFLRAWKTILEKETLFENVIFAEKDIPLSVQGAYILAQYNKLI